MFIGDKQLSNCKASKQKPLGDLGIYGHPMMVQGSTCKKFLRPELDVFDQIMLFRK